VTYFKD